MDSVCRDSPWVLVLGEDTVPKLVMQVGLEEMANLVIGRYWSKVLFL